MCSSGLILDVVLPVAPRKETLSAASMWLPKAFLGLMVPVYLCLYVYGCC